MLEPCTGGESYNKIEGCFTLFLIGEIITRSHVKCMKNFVIKYSRMPMVASLEGGLQAVFLFHMPHFVHFYITYNGKGIAFIKRKRSLSCKTRRLITKHLRNGLLQSLSVFCVSHGQFNSLIS